MRATTAGVHRFNAPPHSPVTGQATRARARVETPRPKPSRPSRLSESVGTASPRLASTTPKTSALLHALLASHPRKPSSSSVLVIRARHAADLWPPISCVALKIVTLRHRLPNGTAFRRRDVRGLFDDHRLVVPETMLWVHSLRRRIHQDPTRVSLLARPHRAHIRIDDRRRRHALRDAVGVAHRKRQRRVAHVERSTRKVSLDVLVWVRVLP
mmetsp:Transcript_17439/g.45294  ORF Transcript_17439/g.45294 Transcript_17439/m.45294 type:complete len:213 (+) Transcript_17439:94-732(+)